MNFFKHLRTVGRHRRAVRKLCFKLGLIRQGLTHDLSKYSRAEFRPGVKYYQGFRSPQAKEREELGYSAAWLHHKGRNKHHFEYWIDYCIGPDDRVYIGGCKMPVKYVAEMFCDRVAACRIYLGEKYTDAAPYDYFIRSKGHILIHPETSDEIERMLLVLKEQGEDAAFAYVRERLQQKS